MIDLKRLRDEPEYRSGIERKRVREGLIDELLAVDERRRAKLTDVEELRAEQNAASKEISQASPEDRPAKIAAATELKERLGALEAELEPLETEVRSLALTVPNPADADVPDGGEDDGEVLRVVGEQLPPPPMDHADYALRMGWIETEHAVEASGSRFAYLMREAVQLEFALVQYAMNTIIKHGFTPVVTPILMREQAMEQAGFFPVDKSTVYEVDGGELYITGTSEVPLSQLHAGDKLDGAELPLRYGGFSSCLRREAGTYGKDTRGIFRVHQFDKVEMFVFCAPDESDAEHARILAIEEEILSGLGFSYHVLNVAAGDLGAPATKKYDLEVWLPSEQRYRELTSCSNYREYSARRMQTRASIEGAKGLELVHTLNGTACAVSRTLVNLFEYYQQPDGSFIVPEVLRGYVGTDVIPAR
ncbi:MAG: serine--tRNA ligase [Actinomycetes bacterium]